MGGEKVRFGLRRLHCLLDAACESTVVVSPRVEEIAWKLDRTKPKLESKYWSPDDPSIHFAKFLNARHCLREGSDESIQALEISTPDSCLLPFRVGVTATTTKTLAETGGGAKCRVLEEAIKEVEVFAVKKDMWNTTTYAFAFEVSATSQGIQISKAQS